MPRPGRQWSTPRSTKSERPRPRAPSERARRRSALDAGRLRPRLEPVLRRRLGAQRRAARDPRQLRRRRRRGAMGRQRLSAAAVGAASARRSARRPLRPPACCWSSAPACSPPPRWSARSRPASRSCSPPAARRASARPCCCPTASPCSTPLTRARSAAGRSASGPPPGAAAAAVAPLIGGWLVDHVGWPAIFYINLPLAAGAILLALRFVTESQDDGAARTDYAGALLATAGLGGTTYGLTLWSSSGSLTTTAIAAIVVGLVLLVVFLGVEKAPRRQGDDAARHVRRPLLLRPQPADLAALRRVRRGDAADSLCADRGRRLFAGRGRAGACCRCRSCSPSPRRRWASSPRGSARAGR